MFNNKISRNRTEKSGYYSCPLCKKGNISNLILMQEVLACDRCDRLFTFNFETQTLESVNLKTSIFWHWNGKGWQIIKPPHKSESIYSGLFC